MALTPLQELESKATSLNHPVNAAIELTYKCNLHCEFCYNPFPRNDQIRTKPLEVDEKEPLSFEEIVSLLDQLKQLDVLYLTLTGGEPILHPRFWDIVNEAKKRTFAIRIFSNGIGITEDIADKIAKLAPHCMEISIHGAKPETCERLNKIPGSFEKFVKAIGFLSERNIRVFLKCIVTKYNENELIEIRDLGTSFGYPVYFDNTITPSDNGDFFPLNLRASDEAVSFLYSADGLNIGNSPFERENKSMNCTTASGTLTITPSGDVQACTQWKKPAGNIREKPLIEIWKTSEFLEKARQITRLMPRILDEEVADGGFCFHCPALSDLKYGDPTRIDDEYLRVAQIRKKVYKGS